MRTFGFVGPFQRYFGRVFEGGPLLSVSPFLVKNAGIRALLKVIKGIAWIADQWDKLQTYMHPPKDLKELQDEVDKPEAGTEVHHIVETQYNSDAPNANAKVFNDGRLESRENKVRIPYWKHRDVTAWYSTPNEEFGWQTPREYMRGKSWEEQYSYGLSVLRKFGALK
ncbi:MAG TPA: hypothetical protein VKZ79_20705 [Alphaproteobacteria bacterium]|nr:hypothetical protein [Alphaproteobacteria bacterium]